MADAMTTTHPHQLPMRCAECRGEFHGKAHNVIGTEKVQGQVAVLCMCDNCLRDIGATASGR